MTGLVRPARRPIGWVAPGPPPRTPPDRADLWPQSGEDLCYLSGDWRILQLVHGKRWSLDDLVTAWVACDALVDRPPRRFVDLGCGIGTVLLMVAWRFPDAHGVGVEAQHESVALARRSIAWNGAAERLTVRSGDLRDPTIVPEDATCDLVTGTPPYLPIGTATESRHPQRAPAHVEHRGGIEAYCAAAARLLGPSGVFVVCEGATQAARVDSAARAAGLVVTQRLDVIPRAGKDALFTVWTMARAGGPTIAATPLVVRDAGGNRTEGFQRVRAACGMPP